MQIGSNRCYRKHLSSCHSSVQPDVIRWEVLVSMNGISSCSPSLDNSFGPYAGNCRGGFDFTLLFEETILSIPLLAIFILILPFRTLQLYKNDKKVVRSPLQLYKLVWMPWFNSTPSDAIVLIVQNKHRHPLSVFQSSSLRCLFYGPELLQLLSIEPELLFLMPLSCSSFLLGFACSLTVNICTRYALRSFWISTSFYRPFSTSREPEHYG